MRIGITTSVIQRGKTGVAQYLFALVRALISEPGSHHLVLFVLEQDLPLFKYAEGAATLIRVSERHRAPVRNILWHQTALPRLIRRHQLELLHVPSYRRMLWPRPCPLVATIHDLAPFRLPGKYDWKRMLYARFVVRRLAWRQDAIIAISDQTARDIHQFFKLPRERITVVHNGVEHSRFFPLSDPGAKADILRHYNLDRPFFLYVARLEHPGKNHVRLISAFEEFKAATHSDWLLVFAGSDWHGAEAIHGTIRASRFAADIRCLGFVPDTSLPDLYRAADVFVYPSLYEGFGMPPVEAMACGCPVISSACGSLAEVIGDAAAVVNPEDIHSIAKQLFIVATGPAERNRLRAAGLAQAAKFDWGRTARESLKVYARVAGSTPRAGKMPSVLTSV